MPGTSSKLIVATVVAAIAMEPVSPCQRSTHASPAPGTAVVIANVNVIPMDRERVLPTQTVVVENQHIVQIGALDQPALPKDAARIDGTGLYLIPGLFDLHAHLQSSREVNLRMLQMFVAAGVTTILNIRGEPSHLELRKEVASG